jgi:hypothetical protein
MEYLTVRQAAEAILAGHHLIDTRGILTLDVRLCGSLLDARTDYRIAPSTITIGGMEVPEPLRTAPKDGTEYFIVGLLSNGLVTNPIWRGDSSELSWLARGLVHLTKEAAIAHAESLIKVSGGEV